MAKLPVRQPRAGDGALDSHLPIDAACPGFDSFERLRQTCVPEFAIRQFRMNLMAPRLAQVRLVTQIDAQLALAGQFAGMHRRIRTMRRQALDETAIDRYVGKLQFHEEL